MNSTIKNIAKLCNVSHTTVSRAINGSPLIKEKTKSRILEAAVQLNYVPNLNAKSLVLQKSYNIGLFFSTLGQGTSSDFFHQTVEGVNRIIGREYNLVVSGIDDYSDFYTINIKRFDGILLISQSDSDDPFIKYILNEGIPLVVLNRETELYPVINIVAAESMGAYNAALYLIKCGHRSSAIIEGLSGFKSSENRKAGFLKALNDNEIKINNDFIVKGRYNIESGYEAMKQLLLLKKRPTAVFCSNDEMAVGAIKAIQDVGLIVPRDISIIGFDDSMVCSYITPELSSVRKPTNEISTRGARRLLSLIRERTKQSERIYIDTELILRKSVSDPPNY